MNAAKRAILPQGGVRIGADVGGTFTDVVVLDGRGNLHTQKVPSTPPHFEEAVIRAIGAWLGSTGISGARVREVAHGTTVATNAVLERRGARTALVTTKGFRDVLELRRIRVPVLYDWFFQKPRELVERYLRFEVDERVLANGDVQVGLRESELWDLKKKLEQEAVQSVAVCFLHAYAYPEHEMMAGRFLRKHLPHLTVSLSSEILPERKEYERTATTAVNAYVRPVMRGYLNALRRSLRRMDIEAPLLIMQSAGGLTPEDDAASRPVFVLESGPAAGVLAAATTAGRMGLANVITFDMGGTTAKASMIEEGRVGYHSEYEVGASLSTGSRLMGGSGELIRAPSLDIAEVGAGGGSMAYLDRAGGLHVGPRSAGAVPGPACYRQGGKEPTVTDANVVLGYVRPGPLANGEVHVDPEAARRAIQDRIAGPLGVGLFEAAEGIHRIANTRIMKALREVSTERGRDPREFVLMAFGGSGPVHAAGLAEELSVQRAMIPELPGLFSALGLLYSDVERHGVRSCLLSVESLCPREIEQLRETLEKDMLAWFRRGHYSGERVQLACSVDMRFRGQTSEIRVPLPAKPLTPEDVDTLRQTFEAEHERLYGHRSAAGHTVEVLAVRLVGKAMRDQTEGFPEPVKLQGEAAPSRMAYFGSRWGAIDTPVVARTSLREITQGPLLIDEYDTTVVVPPATRVWLDDLQNVVMEGAGSHQ
ncbi:MAG: hydantoinase/oxoprolinase family protein [Acidobacteriota bacterium]|nr:hydantoinase/oxoprolinase family protein [Acidobacteriota bacterium]